MWLLFWNVGMCAGRRYAIWVSVSVHQLLVLLRGRVLLCQSGSLLSQRSFRGSDILTYSCAQFMVLSCFLGPVSVYVNTLRYNACEHFGKRLRARHQSHDVNVLAMLKGVNLVCCSHPQGVLEPILSVSVVDFSTQESRTSPVNMSLER